MKEEFLNFVWKYKLYKDYKLFNIESKGFEIVKQGQQNNNAGPDFLEAGIEVAGTKWVGNVEIHVKSSDWDIHKHNLNPAYNNVIMQVVSKHDKDVYTEDGRLIPVMELNFDDETIRRFRLFSRNKGQLNCAAEIQEIDSFKVNMWLSKILVQRLHRKSESVESIFNYCKQNWEETLYILLARSFGFNINSEPFERLAKSIPFNILLKHTNSLFQIEAILFGQAGFLDLVNQDEPYIKELTKEYRFLKKKYSFVSIEKYNWKFLRLRPTNFPTIRIAQFADLIYNSKALFSKIVNSKNSKDVLELLKCQASEFWNTHYTFEKTSEKKTKSLGQQSISLIFINTIVPLLFVYGVKKGDEEIKDKALHFLEAMKAESNSIIDLWKKLGVEVKTSFYSQALLEQKNVYCDNSQCLKCGIGIEVLKRRLKN